MNENKTEQRKVILYNKLIFIYSVIEPSKKLNN